MTQIRDLIEKLTAIQEDRPAKGDGIYLEFGTTLCVESEIAEITESGDYIIHGDDRVLAILESLTNLYEETADEKKARWLKHDDTLFHRAGLLKPTARQQASNNVMVQFQITGMLDPNPTNVRKADAIEASMPFDWDLTPADHKIIFKGRLEDFRTNMQTLQGYGDVVRKENVAEAEYHGRKVPLGKPMAGDVKKSKVYVKNPKTGKVIKVNFGDKKMRIKKSIPGRRKSFRARHNCANPGPRTKARYWSCRAW
jgi:hypothetical protein